MRSDRYFYRVFDTNDTPYYERYWTTREGAIEAADNANQRGDSTRKPYRCAPVTIDHLDTIAR